MGDIKSVFYRIKEVRRQQGKNEEWLIEKLAEKYTSKKIEITRISLLTSLAVDILWKKMKLEDDLMKRDDDESEDYRCHYGKW